MAYIKFKPQIIYANGGYDFTGRPQTNQQVKRKIVALEYDYRNVGKVVYHMQKFNKKTKLVPEYTKGGKLKKTSKVVVVPTHWKLVAYEIPFIVISLLEKQGQKIIQHKHHWEII